MKKYRLFIGDLIVNILVVVICLIYMFFMFNPKDNTDNVCVYVGNKLYGVFSLSEDTEFSPDGNKTFICIKDKKAYISGSDCPDGLCKATAPITQHSKSSIICLPNKVAITKMASDILQDGGVDVVAG